MPPREMPKSKTGVDLMNCSSDNSLYEEGEKVWASYSDKWYEAKVKLCILSCILMHFKNEISCVKSHFH